jgi:hypothetical protein
LVVSFVGDYDGYNERILSLLVVSSPIVMKTHSGYFLPACTRLLLVAQAENGPYTSQASASSSSICTAIKTRGMIVQHSKNQE